MEKNKKGISNWELVIRCFALLMLVIFSSCSITNQISKQANTILLKDTAISTGHIGISIYEPATNKYWYNYDATKYFIPASNTKLFSLYAGMKYLGDSLVGLRYEKRVLDDIPDWDSTYKKILMIEPTGDPTFLHPDFKKQPVNDFLKNFEGGVQFSTGLEIKNPYGTGWTKDDYNEDYMVPRTAFPIYGNLIRFKVDYKKCSVTPSYLIKANKVFVDNNSNETSFKRDETSNNFYIKFNTLINYLKAIPIFPDNYFVINMLSDTLKKGVGAYTIGPYTIRDFSRGKFSQNILHSQPSDSLFKPMMHNSDNFFAEQTLLMASNEYLGYMSDEKIIDTILNTDLKNIPQKPKWVDGSGLSRYNLFTPKSFVYILNKMKNEFGLERMKVILPTGGEGTLTSYYKKNAGFIYAKTGTLSNNCALSGYLITNNGKLLIFSVLANNYITGTTPVRKAVEQFLQQLQEKY